MENLSKLRDMATTYTKIITLINSHLKKVNERMDFSDIRQEPAQIPHLEPGSKVLLQSTCKILPEVRATTYRDPSWPITDTLVCPRMFHWTVRFVN